MGKDCGHKVPCGCGDTPLTTPPACNEAEECAGEPCSELFDAGCVAYNGDDILCEEDIVVTECDRVDVALNKIVDYFCDKVQDVYSNSVWVDVAYGNDETGEYGNFSKPYKTVVAAQISAYNYMNDNPNLYDMSKTTYKVTTQIPLNLNLDTEIVSIEAPRVRIHIAPGVYYGSDDFQYMVDNPELFSQEVLASNPPEQLLINNSFNLMMPYVDYELDAGATLIDYGFNVYFMIGEILEGYVAYDYNTEPPDNGVLTRVFGNGTLFSSKAVAPYFSFGLPLPIYLEPNCKLEIECEQHNLVGYFYGGTFKSKTKTYIVPFTGFENSELPSFGGTTALYFDQEEAMPNSPTSERHEIISDTIIVDWGSNEDMFHEGNLSVYSTLFIFSSKSFDLVCDKYMGRSVAQNYLDGQFAPLYSRDRDNVATPQWVYNYFTTFSANEAASTLYTGNYYDDNEVIVNISIKHARFGRGGLYFENNGSGVSTNQVVKANIDIPLVDFTYYFQLSGGTEGGFFETKNFFLSVYGDENVYVNVPDTHIEIKSADIIQPGVDNWATLLGYEGDYRVYAKIKTRLLDSVTSVEDDRHNCFLAAGKFASSISPNVFLNGCVMYSENNIPKDVFFGSYSPTSSFAPGSFDIKIYGNCYTNTIDIYDDGFGPINVINTIPETKLIVSSNVKI